MLRKSSTPSCHSTTASHGTLVLGSSSAPGTTVPQQWPGITAQRWRIAAPRWIIVACCGDFNQSFGHVGPGVWRHSNPHTLVKWGRWVLVISPKLKCVQAMAMSDLDFHLSWNTLYLRHPAVSDIPNTLIMLPHFFPFVILNIVHEASGRSSHADS